MGWQHDQYLFPYDTSLKVRGLGAVREVLGGVWEVGAGLELLHCMYRRFNVINKERYMECVYICTGVVCTYSRLVLE